MFKNHHGYTAFILILTIMLFYFILTFESLWWFSILWKPSILCYLLNFFVKLKYASLAMAVLSFYFARFFKDFKIFFLISYIITGTFPLHFLSIFWWWVRHFIWFFFYINLDSLLKTLLDLFVNTSLKRFWLFSKNFKY